MAYVRVSRTRVAQTLHLLAVADPMDDTYHRQMHKQLTVQASRDKLARDICHGRKGTSHQAYQDGWKADSALCLIVSAVVLWTTRCVRWPFSKALGKGHRCLAACQSRALSQVSGPISAAPARFISRVTSETAMVGAT